MKTTPLTATELAASVVAVPPLARGADLQLSRDENLKIVRHIEAGGVRTLLYGGNANFYHVPLAEYESLLAFLAEAAGPETMVVPSVGPSYGKLMDQARFIAESPFATSMVLPHQGVTTSDGVATGIRRFVEACGKPVLLYIKFEGYLEPEDAARLFSDGLVSVVKYAIVREDPAQDDYLSQLVERVDPKRIMSGIGEQPAIAHLRDFGLGGFTSGCVCVGPALSMQMLRALQQSNYEQAERIRRIFVPLEDLRNAISPIRVLHEAVRLAGIADTGPILPLLSNLDADRHEQVKEAATALLREEQAARGENPTS